jgi:hypothetical protein
MKAAIRSSALARIFLVAGFGVALSAMPANAQKAGGSITVGLEVDIPGFDPLGGVDSKDSLLGANQIQDCIWGGSLGCDGSVGFERRGVGADGAADHRPT